MDDKTMSKVSNLQAESIEDLSIDYSQFGVKLRRQIDKKLLKKGGPWAALAFEFQDFNGEGFGSPEIMLAAFKSKDSMYKRYSYFIVKDKEMAEKIINALKECFNISE